ncbi:MAG TPA: glycerol-3-phosphate acyltransferase [Ilumatobacteraceae bacterium]
MEVAVTLVVGYLVGSLPIAGLVARRHGVPDLRAVGDRNPGYWNAKTMLGRRAALPVFAGDLAKGALAAAVGVALAADGQWWLAYLATGAAMIGHAYPVFAGFRGGRSVLTFVGGFAVYAPAPAAVAGVVLLVVWAATRRFDVAARVGIVAMPLAQLVLDGPVRTAATGALMTLIGLRFAQAARRTGGRATSDVA